MTTSYSISPISALPAGIDVLADSAMREGFGMVSRLVIDHREGTSLFDAPGEGLWEARASGGLIGVCGMNRDPFAAPSELAGRVRRLYVVPGWRRRGVAGALLDRIVDHARGHFTLLTAFTTAETAVRFYEARGFHRVTGVERRTFERVL